MLGEDRLVSRAFTRVRRPLGRWFLRRQGRAASLERLGNSVEEATAGTAGILGPGRRVLVLSLRSWPPHNAFESVIAQGLRVRGAEVAMLTCGGGQPLCEQGWARHAWPTPCDRCGWYTDEVASAARLRHYRLADDLPWGDDARRAPAEAAPASGQVDPRRTSDISVAWMLRSADVEGSPRGSEMLADFAVAAGGVASWAERVIDDFRPDTVFLVGGLFAAERTFMQVARAREIRVITYEVAQRENSLVFAANKPAGWFETADAWERLRDTPLTDPQRRSIESLLNARSEGRGAAERYYDNPLADPDRLRQALELPDGARVVSMFTNLTWDSAVVGRDLAYDSMLDWVADSVRTASELHGTALVVRVHPGEERWGTMQPVAGALGELPANVRLIGPEQAVSSYGLLELSDLVLAYSTTVGLEAATRGVPVAVAGQTHYRDRGFTYDLDSPDGLRQLLRAGDWSITDEQVELAFRYAFMFFFRFLTPFPAVPLEQGLPASIPEDAAAIGPGADPYLDFVCEQILDGGDFLLPEELACAS